MIVLDVFRAVQLTNTTLYGVTPHTTAMVLNVILHKARGPVFDTCTAWQFIKQNSLLHPANDEVNRTLSLERLGS